MSIKQKIFTKYVKTKFKLLSKVSPTKAAEEAFKLLCTPLIKPKINLSTQFMQAERLQFVVQGFTVKGFRFNYHTNSKKILIVHGFQSAAFKFNHFIKPFTNLGYEILVFDAPAHGASTGKRLHALLYKDMIQHVDKLYGPIDIYITHSLGGLATSLALEEKSNLAQKLILIAPATETISAIKMIFQILALPNNVQQAFEKVITKINNHPSSWYSVARIAPHLKCKVLWIHDEHDELTPFEDVKKVLHQHLPNVTFMITQHLGHRRIYHNHQVLERIKAFLNQ